MKKHNRILVIGSGPLKIAQAGEFDYSGTQAVKALREEGIYTILINSNIASIQTSINLANQTYLLPITPYFIEQIIKKEKPDGVMISFGGQTALNSAIKLFKSNIFKSNNVEIIGTPISSIILSENRTHFKDRMESLDIDVSFSKPISSKQEVISVADEIGYPVIIRTDNTLGGMGSGVANNISELVEITRYINNKSILIEKYLKGWKEIEYEIIRDYFDNCIAVCNMENIDPLGIHTGDSMVVCPSQTLSNDEYFQLREISFRIARNLNIIGACNVQFAVNPNSTSLDYKLIEINARLSRSSALASKATGYPIAFISAKLGLGYTLPELKNKLQKNTSAFFEPALDYIVLKIPKWDFKKFDNTDLYLNTKMKSVGEIMSIGRSFEEALQKGIRMLNNNKVGIVGNIETNLTSNNYSIEKPTENRIFDIVEYLKRGVSIKDISEKTNINIWFLQRIQNIFTFSKKISNYDSFNDLSKKVIIKAKRLGFSDKQITRLILGEQNINRNSLIFRSIRKKIGVTPVVKQIDIHAGDVLSESNYLYISYNGLTHDVEPVKKNIIVLGSGAYSIGASVEFDWCGVNTVEAIKEEGYKGIVINCNPETVSTDYDISDRLYFEALDLESVLDITDFENPKGIVLCMGGQVSNNLVPALSKTMLNILGTLPSKIQIAENRFEFSKILDRIGVNQPAWTVVSSKEATLKEIKNIGYPVIIRPSYVLGGESMEIIFSEDNLNEFFKKQSFLKNECPYVLSKYIENATEVEFDAVSDNGDIIIYAISEHIEQAGTHSGDTTICFPTQNISSKIKKEILNSSLKIANSLNITGPFNVQFIIDKKNDTIKVIECNLRASRTFPFISKVSGINFVKLATQIILKQNVNSLTPLNYNIKHVGVKSPQFSFRKISGFIPRTGVKMFSTGEAGAIDSLFPNALLKSLLSVGYQILKPLDNILLIIDYKSDYKQQQTKDLLNNLKLLKLNIFTTLDTYERISKYNIKYISYHSLYIDKLLKQRHFALVIHLTHDILKDYSSNSFLIRRKCVDLNTPLMINLNLTIAYTKALLTTNIKNSEIKSLEEYHSNST